MRNGPYELVIAPDDYPGKKYRGRYCYEHHLVWWRNTGRMPLAGHLIHHRNERKRDNAFSNLEEKLVAVHSSEHTRERHPPLVIDCGMCGSQFEIQPSRFRERRAKSRSGKLFCSRSCGTKFNYQ